MHEHQAWHQQELIATQGNKTGVWWLMQAWVVVQMAHKAEVQTVESSLQMMNGSYNTVISQFICDHVWFAGWAWTQW